VEATDLTAQAIALFEEGLRSWAEAAATGDGTALAAGTEAITAGAELLSSVESAIRECGDEGGVVVPTTAPDELAVTVFLRTAEIVLEDTVYADLDDEVLIAGAQAACRALDAGEDPTEVVLAALAATPAAGEPLGGEIDSLALIMATSGVVTYCPDLIEDEDAYRSSIASAISQIIVDQ
jgi:hypothetical protein